MEWIYLILLFCGIGALYHWQISHRKKEAHRTKLISTQHEIEARTKTKVLQAEELKAQEIEDKLKSFKQKNINQ